MEPDPASKMDDALSKRRCEIFELSLYRKLVCPGFSLLESDLPIGSLPPESQNQPCARFSILFFRINYPERFGCVEAEGIGVPLVRLLPSLERCNPLPNVSFGWLHLRS